MNISYLVYLLILGHFALVKTEEKEENCIGNGGEEGTCVRFQDCPTTYSLVKQIVAGVASDDDRQKVLRSLCSNKTMVCCPKSQLFTTTTTTTTQGTTTLQIPSFLHPETCGKRSLADRIIAGQDAPLGMWPWMVILRGRFKDQRSSWFHGGTLISDLYVLTAAHAFHMHPQMELEFVRIGEHNLGRDPDCDRYSVCAPPAQDIPVERIILHPLYDSPCRSCNDIALLRLSKPANFDTIYVQPICLPFNFEVDLGFSKQDFQGKIAWITGWGTINPDSSNPRIPDVLQQTQLPIENNLFCNLTTMNYSDPSMVICAGGDGKDTCRGDSGGPLMLTGKSDSQLFLIGVTSLGPKRCGSRHSVGIYTNVHHYLPWIINNMAP